MQSTPTHLFSLHIVVIVTVRDRFLMRDIYVPWPTERVEWSSSSFVMKTFTAGFEKEKERNLFEFLEVFTWITEVIFRIMLTLNRSLF